MRFALFCVILVLRESENPGANSLNIIIVHSVARAIPHGKMLVSVFGIIRSLRFMKEE